MYMLSNCWIITPDVQCRGFSADLIIDISLFFFGLTINFGFLSTFSSCPMKLSIRHNKKAMLYWPNLMDPQIRPDLGFFLS